MDETYTEKQIVRIKREGTGVTLQVAGRDSATVVRPSTGRAEDVEAGLRLAFRVLGYTVEPFPPAKPIVTAAEWEAIEFCNPGARYLLSYYGKVCSSTEIEGVDDYGDWTGRGVVRRVGSLDARFKGVSLRESLVINPRCMVPDPTLTSGEIAWIKREYPWASRYAWDKNGEFYIYQGDVFAGSSGWIRESTHEQMRNFPKFNNRYKGDWRESLREIPE